MFVICADMLTLVYACIFHTPVLVYSYLYTPTHTNIFTPLHVLICIYRSSRTLYCSRTPYPAGQRQACAGVRMQVLCYNIHTGVYYYTYTIHIPVYTQTWRILKRTFYYMIQAQYYRPCPPRHLELTYAAEQPKL